MSTEVGEANGWRKGLTVAEVSGKLINIWPPEERDSTKGDGSTFLTQNGKLKLDDGSEIFLKITGNEIPQNYRGRIIRITCGEDGKGKVKGIEYNTWYSEKKEEEIEELKVSAYATVEPVGSAGGAGATRSTTSAKKPIQRQSNATQRAPSKARGDNPNLILKAIDLVHSQIVKLVEKRGEFGVDLLQSYVATMFIAADKKGVIEMTVDVLAALEKPAKQEEQEEEQEQEQEQEVDRSVDQTPPDDDPPSKKVVKKTVKKSSKADWSQSVMADNDKIPEEYRGKKFAEVVGEDGGREFLTAYCVKLNASEFITVWSKALRQFCLDFKLVEPTDEDPNLVQAAE